MAIKTFVRDNVVLVVGLALPILLMIGFLAASSLPQRLADPPRYSLVFSVSDYSSTTQGVPIAARLVVKDGVLKAQYTKTVPPAGGYVNNGWKKLYLYDATTRSVRELAFGFPANPETIEGMREETVEATRDLRFDTNLRAPDGYELTQGGRSGSGLISEIFWRSSDWNGPRLTKDGSSVSLTSVDGRPVFAVNAVEFVGWVATPGAP
jgi:hypothetical protein